MRLRGLIVVAALACLITAPSAFAAAAPDPEIAGLQVALRSKGLYFGKIDGVAGPMTAKGLRSFQRLTGLPVTGELGPRTRAELGALGRPLSARSVLVQGTYGWDVSALQFLLARAGHLRLLDVDGHFGGSTKAGVMRFQRSRGLSADGIAGPATRSALGRGPRTPVVARATSNVRSYLVRPGDTLTAIATKHMTTVRALAKVNNLRPEGVLLQGKKLRLPTGVGIASDLSRSTVRSHIDRWAAHYGVSVSLARALA
jgi:LysM repeat protein